MANPPRAASASAKTSKPPIILVHGFRGSPIGLEEVAKHLRAAGYQVYTPAIPPFAGAPALEKYTPEHYANYLAGYITTQQLDHPVLIGHSMGSIVVSATISAYPDLVNSKSILLSPISSRTAPPFRLVAPLSALLPSRVVDYITTKYLIAPHDRKTLQDILEVTHLCGVDHSPNKKEVIKAAFFSTRYSVPDFTPSQDLLLLAGERDHLVKQKHTVKAATKLQAQLEFLPGTGHLHNYEQPQATAAKIIEFLEQDG